MIIPMMKNVHFKIKEFWVKNKKELIILFMTMLVVYIPFLTGQLNNADGFMNGVIAHKKSYDWENSQGRFLIGWFDRWRDRMVQPSLIIGVCLMLLCLVVSVIWYIFDCYSMVEKLCIGAILVFSPSIADLFTYYYCADSYMLSYLLAVIAAALLIKGEKKRTTIGSAVLLIISLAIYQTYIGITASLCCIYLLLEILNGKELKILLKKALRMALAGGGACAAYLLILKVLEKIGYLQMTATRGMNHMLSGAFLGLKDTMKNAYVVFYDYFLTERILTNSWQYRRYLNGIVLCFLLMLCIVLIVHNRVYRSIKRTLLTVFLIVVMPLMIDLVVIIAPAANVYAETGMLMLAGMNLIYVLLVLLVFRCNRNEILEKTIAKFSKLTIILIIINQIIFIGIFIRTIQLEQTKMQMLAYQMEKRIEEFEDYHSGCKVLVAGRPQNGNYPITDQNLKNITHGMISQYTLVFGAEEQVSEGWISVFQYFLGVNYETVYEEERTEILSSEEFAKMGIFPDQTSVKKFNDTIVIKLSN